MPKSKFLLAAEAKIAERKRRESQMTDVELQSERDAKRHADSESLRERHCAGVDLVAKALKDPETLTEVQRVALLGRPADEQDLLVFLRCLKGCNPSWHKFRDFQWKTWGFEQLGHLSPELCKFTLCDWRVHPQLEAEGDGNAAIEELFREQLRLEQEEDRLEKARDRVRQPGERRARHFARRMLDEYNAAIQKGDEPDPNTAGEQVRPKTPLWIQDIAFSRQKYGFVIYETQQVNDRPAAKKKWLEVFEDHGRPDNFAGYRRGCDSIFGGQKLVQYMSPRWNNEHHVSDSELSGLPRHFRTYVAPTLGDTRYLPNTFLVLANDCIFPELDTNSIEERDPLEFDRLVMAEPRVPNTLLPHDVPTFFVWAYDANWRIVTSDDTDSEAISLADDDGYDGRVKVDIKVLFTWFYYARLEGKYNLKDLWRKAKGQKDETWTCWSDNLDPTQPDGLI